MARVAIVISPTLLSKTTTFRPSYNCQVSNNLELCPKNLIETPLAWIALGLTRRPYEPFLLALHSTSILDIVVLDL